MLDVSLQVRRAVQDPAKAELNKLNTFMMNTLMGSGRKAKSFYFMEGYFVTNILTIMERLDKELETRFLGFYEGLSEHAHPNAHGMALTYVETHEAGVTTYTNQKRSRVDVSLGLAIGSLASALQIADMGELLLGHGPGGVHLASREDDLRRGDVATGHFVSDSSTKRRHLSNIELDTTKQR